MTTNELHPRQEPSPAKAGGNPAHVIALAPDAQEIEIVAADRIEINLADIVFALDNPNKHTPEDIQALADSIRQFGRLNDPIVYRDGGRYPLIAGEGRIRAELLLARKTTYVRCLKHPPSDMDRGDLALIDNVLHNDSLADPLMFGLACRDNMARTGRSTRELAKVLKNKDHTSIARAVALVNKLPQDLIALIRQDKLPPAVAQVLTGLHPDAEKQRHFSRLYTEGAVKTGQQLAAAIRAAKNGGNGHATGVAGFSCMENGCKIVLTLPGQDLAVAETALRSVLKNLRDHGGKGLEHFQAWLDKRARALQAAEKLQRAKDALDAM